MARLEEWQVSADAQRVAQLLCRESFDVTVCPQGDLARQFD